ncbi:MAG: bifunctional phosphoribosylaminoimidazolecarboxamide formyltransferase/IMP cyclohydrolase, partial [Pauljensenia sp.]
AHTAAYDLAIAGWLADQLELEDVRETLDDAAEAHLEVSDAAFLASLGYRDGGEDCVEDEPGETDGVASGMPVVVADAFERVESLRYGENPHQGAAVYREIDESFEESDPEDGAAAQGIANAIQLHGKAMSYNNYTDGDAALRAAYDHERPCVAIIKHANPCGIAVGEDVAEAHRLAHACDPVSAFGGVIAVNRPVSVELARQIVPIFTEVVLAPGYDEGALEVLRAKKNLRVLQVQPPARGSYEFKQISGGLLVQERDDIDAPGDSATNWTLAAGAPADERTLADLEFAWRAVRSVRSNAILLVKDGASVGVGMGQVNRVDSCKLAVERANTLGARSTGDAAASEDAAGGARASDVVAEAPERRSVGAVAASDAFFPFADGLQVLIDAGVSAVVQPGGSVRDQESIDAANAAGITMYLTGTRHFAH